MVSFFLELDNVKALLPAQYHFFYPEGDNDKAVLPARYHSFTLKWTMTRQSFRRGIIFFYLEVDDDKTVLPARYHFFLS